MKGLSYNTVTHYSISLIGIISSILIARMIGPEGRGIYAKIILIILLLNEFAGLGFYKTLTFYVSKYKNASLSFYYTFLKISLPFTIILAFLSFNLINIFISSDLEKFLLKISLIYLFFYIIFHSSSHIIHGLNEFKVWNFFRILQTVVWLLIILFFFLFFNDFFNITVLVIVFLINQIIFSLTFFVVYLLRKPKKNIKITKNQSIDFIRYNFKNFVLKLIEKFYTEFDLIMITLFFDYRILGIYAIAKSISLMSMPLFSSFSEKMFQKMSEKFDKNLLIKNILILVIASIIGYLSFFFIGRTAIDLFYGNEFSEAYNIVTFLLINTILTGFIYYNFDILRSLEIFFRPSLTLTFALSFSSIIVFYLNDRSVYDIIKIMIFANIFLLLHSYFIIFKHAKKNNSNRI